MLKSGAKVVFQIEDAADETAIHRVQVLLDRAALHQSEWNAADFQIVRGDYTCVDESDGDPYDTAKLFSSVQHALSGES